MELSALLISKFPFDSDLIISDYQKIENMLISLLDINKIKFCYFYREFIHDIIYQEEKTIFIENYYGVSFLFYLSLLINENPDIVNYSYSIDLIKNIANINIVNINRQQNNLLKQLIISKFILDLIYNYYGSDNCSQEEKNILEDIENKNIQFIKNKVTEIFKEFNLNLNSNDIIKKKIKIDLIYDEIICALIKSRKFEDYEYTCGILKDLDLENIDITKNMYVKLSQLLNNNENYITDYIIINKEDLFNEKKINFYYILIKYILKNSIYIYNIPFLLKTRKNIIKIIRTQLFLNFNNDKSNMKEKIEYILKKIIDSEYYYNKYLGQKDLDQKYNDVKIVLNYYKNFLFESKKDIIISFENAIKDGTEMNEDYFKDLEEAKRYNDRFSIINYIYNITNNDNNIQKSEDEIKKDVESWEVLEKMIKDKKIKKIKKDNKEKLFNYFNEENEKNIIKIFDENIYDFIMKEKTDYYNEKNNINKSDNFSRESDDNNLKKNTILLQSNYNNQIITNNGSTAYIKSITNKVQNNQKPESESESTEEENIIEKTYENIINQILNKSYFIFHTNKKGIEPFILYDDILYGEHNISLDENKFKKMKKFFEKKDSKLIQNFKLFTQFLEEFEKNLKDIFIYDYNIQMKMKFQKNNNKIKEDENKDINNISVIYTFYPPIQDQKKMKFKDDNILIYKTNTITQGFQYLILTINDIIYIEKYEKSFNEETKNNTDSSLIDRTLVIGEKSLNFTRPILLNESKVERNKADKMKIIEFKKIIGHHNSSKSFCAAEFIKELSNGYFISGGTDNRLMIYNENFEKEEGDFGEISSIRDWTYSISERNNFDNKNKNNIQYLACSNKEMYLTEIDFNNKIIKAQKYEIPTITCTNSVEMEGNNFVMIGLNGAIYFIDMFKRDNKKVENYVIIKKTYRNALKITDTLLVLTSNKNAVNGEDALIFFDTRKKFKKKGNNNISYKIENYSFNLNTNGLALMNCDKENKINILLCACKKYSSDQKNGILLVNPKYEDNEQVKLPFYDTKEFEVYCFCPLFEVNVGGNIISESEDIISRETKYFLVGGYDNNRKQGIIKLYKLIYDNKVFNTRIKYLQDIIIKKRILSNNENENFEGFEGAISCITQSKRKGNILVSCYDGKIYLLSEPNLEFYINKDKKFEEKKEKER